MKPRIEKKLSKRLTLIAPTLFKGWWIDDEWCGFYDRWKSGKETSGQRRALLQARVSVNHIPSIGGECDYWGEETDHYTLWKWLRMNWEWLGDFHIYPQGHRFAGYPDVTGFRQTTRNLLKLAADYEAKQQSKVRP